MPNPLDIWCQKSIPSHQDPHVAFDDDGVLVRDLVETRKLFR